MTTLPLSVPPMLTSKYTLCVIFSKSPFFFLPAAHGDKHMAKKKTTRRCCNFIIIVRGTVLYLGEKWMLQGCSKYSGAVKVATAMNASTNTIIRYLEEVFSREFTRRQTKPPRDTSPHSYYYLCSTVPYFQVYHASLVCTCLIVYNIFVLSFSSDIILK